MSVALTDRALLETWAASRERTPAAQAATLLERALAPSEPLEGWAIARRNAALLELRMSRWGPALNGVATCPGCEGELEFSFDLELLARAVARASPGEAAVGVDGFELRVPTAKDVAAARARGADARRDLISRCLLAPAPDAELDEALVERLGRGLAEADPVGAAELELSCPDCGYEWTQALALEAFVAREAEAEARRIAGEVHALASAYGWSEAEVLAVPPERRRVYLELVG
jgi:hypothetical protein